MAYATYSATEETAWAGFEAAKAAAASGYDAAVAAAGAVYQGAVQAADAQWQSTEDSAWAQEQSALTTAALAMQAGLDSAWTTYETAVQSALDAWQVIVDQAGVTFQAASSAAMEAWHTAADSAWATLQSVIDTANAAWQSTEQGAWSTYTAAVDAALSDWNSAEQTAASSLFSAVGSAWSAWTDGEEAAWDSYLSAISGEEYPCPGPRDDGPPGFGYGSPMPPTAEPPMRDSPYAYVSEVTEPSNPGMGPSGSTPPATTPPNSSGAPITMVSERKTGPAPAPTYDPAKWTNDTLTRKTNNCYSYALNRPTMPNGKPWPIPLQPGMLSGQMMAPFNYANDLNQAAIRDGARPMPKDGKVPAGWHKIQAAYDPSPGGDFHWYRQDADGTWSSKYGTNKTSELDALGRKITDPEKADRNYQKPGRNYSRTLPPLIVPN